MPIDKSAFDVLVANVETRLGAEQKALISEELLNIKTTLNAQAEQIDTQDGEIAKLKQTNAELVQANSRLFMKLGAEPDKNNTAGKNDGQKKDETEIKLSDLINEKGEIIKK